MEKIGLWDDTLIIVTADHGEALFEHGRWEHGASVLEEVARVPLIVRGPGIKPGRSEIPASLVDLVPTILEAVEIDSSSDFFGNSLWTSMTMGRVLEERDIIVEGTLYGAEQRAIIRWPYQAIHQVAGDKKLLFDLEADPYERVDLSTSYPAQRDQMMESLRDALVVAVGERSVSSGVELHPALMKNLRALGYIR